jgi:CubicO group peptidase (beta-lactamase class C family)
MNPSRYVWAAVLLAFCSASACGQALASRIDSVFAPLATQSTPGVAVLVRQSGGTVFEQGNGVRDMRANAKIDGRTDSRLDSCTKQRLSAPEPGNSRLARGGLPATQPTGRPA